MVDKNAQKKVILQMEKLVNKYSGLPILEIGPGQGDLTQHFFDWGRDLIALEIDTRAVEYLKGKFDEKPNFRLYEVNASNIITKKAQIEPNLPDDFVLLSSLPYNVGSRILVDLPIYFPHNPFAVILQKEVVEKITKEESFTFFGAWIQLFWECRQVVQLSPNVFSPKPKVYSSLLVAEPLLSNDDKFKNYLKSDSKHRLEVKEILKKLFGNPSKTLINNLKNLNWDKKKNENFVEHYNIDRNLRLEWTNYKDVLEKIVFFN